MTDKTIKPYSCLERFAIYLGKPDAIEHPEKYLGPNWETVINFWKWLDKLSYEQLDVAKDRYREAWDNSYGEWYAALHTAIDASKDVVGEEISNAAWFAASCDVTAHATHELIAMHKILDGGKTLYFIPMFDGL